MLKSDTIYKVFFYFAILLLCCALSIQFNSLDMDLFSRFLMGNYVVHNFAIPYNDFVSYTTTHTWFDHEWLLSVIFYLIVANTKLIGVTLIKAILCFLCFITVDLAISDRVGKFNYSYKLPYLCLFLYFLLVFRIFDSLRCQHLTFFLFPLFILLLNRIRNNYNSKIIYFIPFIMLFWLNSHGGALAGLGIILLYAIGEAINKKPFKKYLILFTICALMLLINPWSFNFIPWLYETVTANHYFIGEYQPPSALPGNDSIPYYVLWGILIFLNIYSIIRTRKIDWVKILILLVVLGLSVRYIKHFSLLIFSFFIFCYDDFKLLIDDILNLIKLKINDKIAGITNYLILFIAIGYSIFAFLNFPLRETFWAHSYEFIPNRPLQFLKDNGIKGNIFAPYHIGGYIAYTSYPDLKIYMDGRQEQVYPQSVFDDAMSFLFMDGPNSLSVLQKYRNDIILVEKYWRVNMYLPNSYYKPVYEDDKYRIYLAPNKLKYGYSEPIRTPDYNVDTLFDIKREF